MNAAEAEQAAVLRAAACGDVFQLADEPGGIWAVDTAGDPWILGRVTLTAVTLYNAHLLHPTAGSRWVPTRAGLIALNALPDPPTAGGTR